MRKNFLLFSGILFQFIVACSSSKKLGPDLLPADSQASSRSLFAPQLESKRAPASLSQEGGAAGLSSTGPLTIYLIHGWFGSPESFGDLKLMLLRDLTAENDQKIRVVPLNYSLFKASGHAKITAAIANQIRNDYAKNNISHEAPYSIIAHSQGGVVGMRYILKCVAQNRCEENGTIPKKLKHFISLGSPFWGTGMSELTKESLIKEMFHKFDAPLKQLKDLATGSASLNFSRKTILRLEAPLNKQIVGKLPPEIEMTSISGDLSEKQLNMIERGLSRIFAGKKTETDLMVDVYASRPDFLYYLESDDQKIPPRSGEIKLAKNFYVTKLAHTALPGVLGLTSFDLSKEITSYTIIKKILNEYFGNLEQPEAEEAQIRLEGSERIESFSSEIKVYAPENYARPIPLTEKNVQIAESSDNLIDVVSVQNTSFWQFFGMARKSQSIAGSDRHQIFFHTGRFKSKFAYKPNEEGSYPASTATLHYRLKIPGWVEKEFEVPVKPSMSTFSEIHLEPFQPYKIPEQDKDRLFDDEEKYLIATAPVHNEDFKVIAFYAAPGSPNIQQKLSRVLDLRELASESARDTVVFGNTGYCHAAVAGKKTGPHKNTLYLKFGDQLESRLELDEKSNVIVYGRYKNNTTDRYLVWASGSGTPSRFQQRLYWMNVADLDVTSRAPCMRVSGY